MFSTSPSSSLIISLQKTRSSWCWTQMDLHASCEHVSVSEYPGIRLGPAPPTMFANSLSIFIGPQLDIIGYLSFDRPCRSVLGPPCRSVDRRSARVRVRSPQKITFHHTPWTSQPRKRANFTLKFSSRDAL